MPPTDLAFDARTQPLGPGEALLLSVRGVYRPGASGNPDAAALENAVAAALDPARHRGLVLDLSNMSYSGGDALGALLLKLASGARGPPLLTVLVAADANRAALLRLLELMGRKVERWLHGSVEAAFEALRDAKPGGSCDP